MICKREGSIFTKIVEVKKGTGFDLEDYGTEV